MGVPPVLGVAVAHGVGGAPLPEGAGGEGNRRRGATRQPGRPTRAN